MGVGARVGVRKDTGVGDAVCDQALVTICKSVGAVSLQGVRQEGLLDGWKGEGCLLPWSLLAPA
jgi:hypothetical protein